MELQGEASGADWTQPQGNIGLTVHFSAKDFRADLPFLMDTGIEQMILWTIAGQRAGEFAERYRVSGWYQTRSDWEAEPSLGAGGWFNARSHSRIEVVLCNRSDSIIIGGCMPMETIPA